MNDFKVMLNRQQQQYLSKMLPKGYSFELYKVRKNIGNYPFKEFDKKYKKNQAIILNKKDSFVLDSIEQSEKSFKEKSEPLIIKDQLKPIQYDLLHLTRKLRKHESSYPFRSPVDPRALQIPDYFDVVLQPIDLKTIEEKIRKDEYEHVAEFQRDIYKMIMNSYKYNQKASTTEKKTIQFEEFYVQTMREYHNSKNVSQNGDKQLVKQQMVDEKNQSQQIKIKEQESKQQQPKQTVPSANVFAAVKTVKQEVKQNSKLFKVMTDIANQRPKHSKKQIPKSLLASNNSKSKSPKKKQPKIKKQQPQEEFSQQSFPINQLLFSQQFQPTQEKDLQSQQIKDEMKSYLDNETQNNKQQIFSEGYNQAALGTRIRNIQVQKQITHLLKKLSEFPLTRQKKIKNLSKFTNLEQNMTQTDKKKLFDKITKLDQNDIECVVKILTKGKCDTLKLEEFQIDLDKADSKVLRQVQNFIALRDQSFVSNIVPEITGSIPLNLQTPPISAQILKIPKKTKKQDKKIIKKKINRKNSNDDSFSLNPPTIKKKKSQKPHKKNPKPDQKSQLNGNDNHSANGDKQESSSYHPQPIHHQHHGKVLGSHFNHHSKNQQTQKNNNNNNGSEKSAPQNKKKQLIQNEKQKTPRPQPQQNNLNYNSPNPYHNDNKFDDIDQFLAISQDPYMHSYSRLRQQSQSIEQLDFMDLNTFGIGNGSGKDYPDEQMRDFSIYQPQKDQNDEDHFF